MDVNVSCVVVGTAAASVGATGSSHSVKRIPVRRPLEPAGKGREHREDPDRHEHGERALAEASVLVVVLSDEPARLAREDEEPEPEGVDAGEERAGDPAQPEDPAVPGTERGREAMIGPSRRSR
jgi:hypothetical protein